MSIRYELEEERDCWLAHFEDGITIGASLDIADDPVLFDTLVRGAHLDVLAAEVLGGRSFWGRSFYDQDADE